MEISSEFSQSATEPSFSQGNCFLGQPGCRGQNRRQKPFSALFFLLTEIPTKLEPQKEFAPLLLIPFTFSLKTSHYSAGKPPDTIMSSWKWLDAPFLDSGAKWIDDSADCRSGTGRFGKFAACAKSCSHLPTGAHDEK